MRKFDHALIVTYGRSGSTLLQGLLNSSPYLHIKGENNNFLFGMFECVDRLYDARRRQDLDATRETTHPWYGLQTIDLAALLNGLRQTAIESLFGDDERICGFKEISYASLDDLTRLPAFLEFIANLLPRAALIFHGRAHEDVAKSGWWLSRNRQDVLTRLRWADDAFTRFIDANPYRATRTTYQQITTGDLRPVFQFLDLPYPGDEAIAAVRARRHSY